MAIPIEKTFQVQEPVEEVWNLLSDPKRVATCVPGAKITEQVDDKTYKGTISGKVGPSATDYKGEREIVRRDAANHELEMVGKGQDVKGRGSASMKMTARARALDTGGTEVTSIAEINVVGLLAQMGARMINEVSNIMFAQFIKTFQAQLERPTDAAPEEAKPVNAASLAWAAAKGAFHRGDS